MTPVRAAPGVVRGADGRGRAGRQRREPGLASDDPLFADGLVEYCRPAAVRAWPRDPATRRARAARLAEVELRGAAAPCSMIEARAAEPAARDRAAARMARGDAAAAIAAAPQRARGPHRDRRAGPFLPRRPGRAGRARRGRRGHCLFLHPAPERDPAHGGASCWACRATPSRSRCRRMGGGFGGKETPGQPAGLPSPRWSPSGTGRPAKCRSDRDDDMIDHRQAPRLPHRLRRRLRRRGPHPGRRVRPRRALRHVRRPVAGRSPTARCSTPTTPIICPRVRHHARCRCKTHTQSNTAFRGFGGPQGMVGDRARDRRDRARRWHGSARRPAGATSTAHGAERAQSRPTTRRVEDCVIQEIVDELEASVRLPAPARGDPRLERGEPDPEARHRADARQVRHLLHQHRDATRRARWCTSTPTARSHLNHGGTEMGQGLNIKVAQVVAEEFQVDIGRVKITATTTGKVPNTSATAASSGTDLNGMAARKPPRARSRRGWSPSLAERHQACARTRCVFLPDRMPRRRAGDPLRRGDLPRPTGARPTVGHGLLRARPRSTGTARRAGAGRSSISPTARRCARSRSTR